MNGKLFNTAKIKSASTKGHKELFLGSLTSKGASPALTQSNGVCQTAENSPVKTTYLNTENSLRCTNS